MSYNETLEEVRINQIDMVGWSVIATPQQDLPLYFEWARIFDSYLYQCRLRDCRLYFCVGGYQTIRELCWRIQPFIPHVS